MRAGYRPFGLPNREIPVWIPPTPVGCDTSFHIHYRPIKQKFLDYAPARMNYNHPLFPNGMPGDPILPENRGILGLRVR